MLTIIIPAFNEEKDIIKVLKKIEEISKIISIFVIVIDDNSSDGTLKKLKENQNLYNKLISNQKNLGKGASLIKSLEFIKTEYLIIQDADLEYSPNDIIQIYNKLRNNFDVVYGSRFLKRSENQFNSNTQIIGNIILTTLSNLINRQSLSDSHTCYKSMKTSIFKSLKLESNGFEICAEINTKLSNKRLKINEIPIQFKGRSYKQGKKIKIQDFFKAIYTIFKFKFIKKNII